MSPTLVAGPGPAAEAPSASDAARRRSRLGYAALTPTVDAGALVPVVGASDPGPLGAVYALIGLLALSATGRAPHLRIAPRVADDLGFLAARLAVPLVLVGPWLAADQPAALFLSQVGAATALVVIGRAVAYLLLRRARAAGELVDRTIVVGAGPRGQSLVETLQHHPEYGLLPVGFVDDCAPADGLPAPLLGGVADLDGLIGRLAASRVIVAFGVAREARIVPLLRSISSRDVQVSVVPRFFDLGVGWGGAEVDDVWGIPLLRVRRCRRACNVWRMKRLVDVAVAGAALVVLAPVLAAIALAVKLTSRGPVIFRQHRVGLDGREIVVLKFRTLEVNDDSDTRWSVAGDARQTAVGRILRKTSLDELPQLVNVVRGDMSLVGPRPERPVFVEEFSRRYPEYPSRHRVPAGLTGWAQVHGLRGNTSIEERVRFDNRYIEHWSLGLDLVIVVRTVGAVVRDAVGRGGPPEPARLGTINRLRRRMALGLAAVVLAGLVVVLPSSGLASNLPFQDGFEGGNLAAWTASSGITAQQGVVDSGAWAARAIGTGNSAWAYKLLTPTLSELWFDGRFHVASQGGSHVSLVRFRTASAGALFSIFRRADGKLMLFQEVAGTSTTGPAVSAGAWHGLKVHVRVDGGSSLIEVWLDGALVSALSGPTNLGAAPVGRVYIGEPAGGRTFDVFIDGITIGTSPDTEAPSIPAGLAAAGSGPAQVDLSWSPATDNVGVAEYGVYRDGARIATVAAPTTAYTDTAATAGPGHSYQVDAADAAGNRSLPSVPVNPTFPSDTSPPTAPTGLTALVAVPGRVDLAWTAAEDDVGVASYTVWRDGVTLATVGPETTTFADGSVAGGRTYTYEVSAADAAANQSPRSPPASATTPVAIFSDGFESGDLSAWTASSGMAVEGGVVRAGSWAARATSSGSPSYAYRSLSTPLADVHVDGWFHAISQGPNNVSLLRLRTDTGAPILSLFRRSDGVLLLFNEVAVSTSSGPALAPGAWHRVAVAAHVAGGAGRVDVWLDGEWVPGLSGPTNLGAAGVGRVYVGDPASGRVFDLAVDEVAVNPPVDTTPPSPPSGLSAATPSVGRVQLSWTAATDDVGVGAYTVYRDGAVLATVDAPATSYADDTVGQATTYAYAVDAVDFAGNRSASSAPVTVDTLGVLFADGFESGDLSAWTVASGMVARQGSAYAGAWAAEAKSTGAPAYAYRTVFPARTEIFYDGRFRVESQGAGNVSLARFRTAAVAPIASVFRTSSGNLSLYDEVTRTTATGPAVTAGVWHRLEVHLTVAGPASRARVWLDHVLAIDVTTNLGSAGVGRVYIGEPATGRVFDLRFDAQTLARAPDTVAPTTPEGVQVAALGPARANVAWSPATDDVAVANYVVYRDGASVGTTGAFGTRWADPTATPSATHQYQVAAVDSAGNSSPLSAPVAVTMPPPSGAPLRIAAAGDIACDPADSRYNGGLGTATACRQRATADLLFERDHAAVLALGDLQYEVGTLEAFQQSYDSSWGAVGALVRPVPGNHEYLTPGAAGYFGYFGPVAGDPSLGYYSFDVGTWHVVALNSECAFVPGGCGPGSPQEQWLIADLAASNAACTLAFWHTPRFSSGSHGNNVATDAFWQALHAAGADVVLVGHDHIYERFAPQTPAGAASATGIRQFVVGTGGGNFGAIGDIKGNSEVREASTFGILELTLHAGGYDWQFVPVAGQSFTDAGSAPCR